jgi:hypothetical protein
MAVNNWTGTGILEDIPASCEPKSLRSYGFYDKRCQGKSEADPNSDGVEKKAAE